MNHVTSEVREDTAIEALRAFVKKWGGLLAVAGGAVGLFYQHKKGVDDLSVAIEQIRTDLALRARQYESDHSISVDGFADPRIRLALDAHIRAVLRTTNLDYERYMSSWRKMLFELNPSLKRPPE